MRNSFCYKTTVRRALLTTCLMAGMLLTGMPASAQDLNSRISRIENEIQTLSRAVFKGETPPPGSLAMGDGVSSATTANTEVRLQQIEMELRKVTGRLEEQSYESQQYRDQMQETLARLEQRIATLETMAGATSATGAQLPAVTGGTQTGQWGGPAMPRNDMQQQRPYAGQDFEQDMQDTDVAPGYDDAAPATQTGGQDQQLGVLRQSPQGQALPPSPQVGAIPGQVPPSASSAYAPPAAEIANDPAGLYERAFSFLRDRNYDEAEKAFEDFLNRYPNHDLAPNAKYWLGETFYVRNNFERAARIFAEAYQQYPKGSKGPDNLLKLGMSLAGLGKNEDACITFSQLSKEYPSGAIPVLMRAEKEMEKLDCSQF